STISQLSMIMAMLGIGTKVAVIAAVFHILNHATIKGSLFMVAGIIDHETGTRDIRKLGGLISFMPITATLDLLGTFSMAGVPLPFLNGFYSKELFFESTLNLNEGMNGVTNFLVQIVPYLAVFGSIFTFVYSVYFFFGVFTGKKNLDKLPKKPHEASVGMLLSPIVLVLGVITIGLFPNLVNGSFLAHAAQSVNHAFEYKNIQFWHGFTTPLLMSLIVVGIGVILYLTRTKWDAVYRLLPGNWSFNKVYNVILQTIDTYSNKVTNAYMNGSVRTYMAIILGTTFIVTLVFLLVTDGVT